MRKIVKYVLVLLLGIMMLTPVKVEAASLSLSASRSSVEVGDTVTFTVSASNGAGRIDLSGAVNDSVFLDNSSQSFSVTATQAGTLTVTASGVLADYDTEADQSFSRSVSVKVNSPSSGGGGSSSGSSGNNGSTSNEETTPEETPEEETPKSTDNTLSSLSVDKGTLSPAFSSDVTDYTVDLTNSETEITISATANDSKASVSGTGLQPLKIGANSFAVDVTSESGSRRSYIVNVNVSETPTVFLEKDGNQMGILNNLESVDIPKGFTETKVTINGQEVTALVNEEGIVTLLYMQNANGEKQFFIYDPNSSDYSIYNPIALCGLDLAVIDIPVDMQAKEGMTYGQVEVDGQTFYGWKFDDTGMENYTLLYLMDGSGTAHYYMHDSVLDNLQIYDNLAPLTAQKLNDMSYDLKVYTYCTYGFGAAAGILLLLMLFFAFKKKRHLAVAGTGMTTEPVKMAKPKKTKKKNKEDDQDQIVMPEEKDTQVDPDLFDEVNKSVSDPEVPADSHVEEDFFSAIPNDAVAFIDPLEPKPKKKTPEVKADVKEEEDEWIDHKMVESVLSDLLDGKQDKKRQ
ncbi:MAG TPA: cadherin-like beta sandwich domain-containing protein [Candidatus Fimiplasma intestinipullorum]|uniref:Cadherin-like beta sandwich domain-containing protein n=1 Tax=Candidatus Fimiplasma intestinipullorum TaxID=2840825 RepID=A0A9D1L0N9_9FIRM|nr:cadherin-like beta sandwich domain-containing protein [Candidatus Fimiplasma intestinipullorum]